MARQVIRRFIEMEVQDFYMGFVVGKIKLGERFLLMFRSSLSIIFPSVLHIHTSVVLRIGNGPVTGFSFTATRFYFTPMINKTGNISMK